MLTDGSGGATDASPATQPLTQVTPSDLNTPTGDGEVPDAPLQHFRGHETAPERPVPLTG
jgi:hypothetical protein